MLLGMLVLRYGSSGMAGAGGAARVPAMAAALTLGGCLWWVAKRQGGAGGASVALALYVCTPLVLRPGAAALGALGLFAMLYTGVGVAHTLQGPRRKWLPRIGLMAGLTSFTAALAPTACAAGLLLAAAAALYLAEGKRGILPILFAFWTGLAAAVWIATHDLLAPLLAAPQSQDLAGSVWRYAGLIAALLTACALWCFARRTRYFGNTAPFVAALFLLALTHFAGQQAVAWALPFALLFAAGCFADALDFGPRRLWSAGFALLAGVQLIASF